MKDFWNYLEYIFKNRKTITSERWEDFTHMLLSFGIGVCLFLTVVVPVFKCFFLTLILISVSLFSIFFLIYAGRKFVKLYKERKNDQIENKDTFVEAEGEVRVHEALSEDEFDNSDVG